MRDLLRSQEVRSAVATELGSSLGRLRPISVVDGPEPGTVGVEVSGRNRDHVQTIAVVAAGAAADLRIQQASVTHDVVTGGVRRLGLEPARTAFVGAGTGLVVALCVLFVLAYMGLFDLRPSMRPSGGYPGERSDSDVATVLHVCTRYCAVPPERRLLDVIRAVPDGRTPLGRRRGLLARRCANARVPVASVTIEPRAPHPARQPDR